MKRNVFCAVLLGVAVVIVIGSLTVFGPCMHKDGSEAVCARAGKGIFADGCMLAVLAAAILIFRKPAFRIGMFLFAGCSSVAGILLPGVLLPVCKMDTMHCRAVMQPAMIILFAAALLVSVGGALAERKRIRREHS